MKIVFYCQYVLGMGHFFRSLQVARALSDHEVTLVVGGQEVRADIPGHVRLIRLPVLYMDEKFTRLIPGTPGRDVEEVKTQRKEILLNLLREIRPDLFLVELYPFGRTIFKYELEPLLRKIGAGDFGHVKRVCSLRDVLVEKKDPVAYEQRVLDDLNTTFDLLLIHSDGTFLPLGETFSRVDDIRIPLHYTGFVTRKPADGAADRIRRQLNLRPGDRLIVASAGGGRTGYRLLKSVVEACGRLRASRRIRVEAFTGPFMDGESFEKISALSKEGISVRRFTKNLPDYLDTADLSISMAGYNTCMDLLVMQIPALVYPYARQQEQPIRAEKIRHLLPVKILDDGDLDPGVMANRIVEMLNRRRPDTPLALNLEGDKETGLFLDRWVRTGRR